MIIKVKGHLTFREIIGKREIELPDDKQICLHVFLRDLSGEIGGKHGQAIYDDESGTVGQYVAIMHNGRHINHLPDGLDTLMKAGDEVSIFPPGAGG